MAKSVSKSEAIKTINSTEELEVLFEVIDRNESSGPKQAKLNRFVSDVQKQIKDERDIILFAIKVK